MGQSEQFNLFRPKMAVLIVESAKNSQLSRVIYYMFLLSFKLQL